MRGSVDHAREDVAPSSSVPNRWSADGDSNGVNACSSGSYGDERREDRDEEPQDRPLAPTSASGCRSAGGNQRARARVRSGTSGATVVLTSRESEDR